MEPSVDEEEPPTFRSDGSVTDRPVRVMADFIHPKARVADASDDIAQADDYHPEWGGWISC